MTNEKDSVLNWLREKNRLARWQKVTSFLQEIQTTACSQDGTVLAAACSDKTAWICGDLSEKTIDFAANFLLETHTRRFYCSSDQGEKVLRQILVRVPGTYQVAETHIPMICREAIAYFRPVAVETRISHRELSRLIDVFCGESLGLMPQEKELISFLEKLRSSCEFYAIKRRFRVVSFAAVGWYFDRPIVQLLYTDWQYRGQGYATALLKSVQKAAGGEILLAANAENEKPLSYYKVRGFDSFSPITLYELDLFRKGNGGEIHK